MLRGAAFDQREAGAALQVSPDRTDFEIIEIRERARVDNCAKPNGNRPFYDIAPPQFTLLLPPPPQKKKLLFEGSKILRDLRYRG